jgi:TRAP-type mannitol/chloroaromatic compound transport system permease large subunit
VPGSLVISNIGACALFAALTGSSPATCAAIGKMGIPEMRKRGYDADLATGAIAAGGTLGILIPPSHHDDPVRHRVGDLDRPAVHRRHHSRPAAHRPVHGLGDCS